MAAVSEEELNEIKKTLVSEGHVNTVFGRAQKVGELRILPVSEVEVCPAGEGNECASARLCPVGMVVVKGDEAEFHAIMPSEQTARWALDELKRLHQSHGHAHDRQDDCRDRDRGRRDHRHDDRRDHRRDCRDHRDRRDHDRRHENDRPPGSGWGPLGEMFAMAFRALHRR